MLQRAIHWVKKGLKKLFSPLFGEEKSKKYVEPTLFAAQQNAYLETNSNKADSFHRNCAKLYEEDIQKSYLDFLAEISPKFRKGKVRLGIDKHEIGYYGKKENFYIIGTCYGNKSYVQAYEYLSVSLLVGKKEERLHLYAIPWHIGQDLTESVATLLNAIKPFLERIEVIEFDRGFCSKELIYWLETNKLSYLIHKPIQGEKIKKRIEQTKSFYRKKVEGKFSANQTTYRFQTNLYICKNIRNKDWLFVSSIWFSDRFQLINLYRNRWQIETNYAINNQNRIMSKTTKYIVRYFYFLCDILLQILWRICSLVYMAFKEFLLALIIGLEKVLEMKPTLRKDG